MMRMFFKVHEKNDDPKAKEMLDAMKRGFDGTDRACLGPVLRHIEGLEANEGSA